MFKIMLAGTGKNSFTDFEQRLEQNADVELIRAASGKNALNEISKTRVDLVVADEDLGDMSNMEFAGLVVKSDPMIYCALVSGLSPEAFHEASEGLGIMCQLPAHPGVTDADHMMEKLRILTRMMQ